MTAVERPDCGFFFPPTASVAFVAVPPAATMTSPGSDRAARALVRAVKAECDRVLIRAVALGELEEPDAVQRQSRLNTVSARWTLLALEEEIIERARRAFPIEPVRTLDAIHIASALVARKAVTDITVLSLDDRVRQAADRLGFPLSPSDGELGLGTGLQDIETST